MCQALFYTMYQIESPPQKKPCEVDTVISPTLQVRKL